MVWLQLFWEFFKAGLFAVGGGLATLPFLYDIAARQPWLSAESMPDMVAVAEATPGPIGVNMATFAGYQAAGIPGGVWATFALVLPSFIIIIIVSKFLERYSQNGLVQSAFTGLRPAVTGLIAASLWQIVSTTLWRADVFIATGQLTGLFNIKAICLFAVAAFLVLKFKKHPIVYIALGAVAGIVFKM